MTPKYDPRLQAEMSRYMRLGQLVDVLSRGLFLPNVGLFEDPWEGHVFHSVTSDGDRREDLARFVTSMKRWVYALCWHAADHESYAMWRLYGKSDAVAIHATFDGLKSLMPVLRDVCGACPSILTTVEYVVPVPGERPHWEDDKVYLTSYEEEGNKDRSEWRQWMHGLLGLKPKAYEFEREVRLLALDQEAPPFWDQMIEYEPRVGIRLPISTADLITRITVSPWAPAWFVDCVRDVATKFGYPAERVMRSSMNAAPKGELLRGPG